MVTYLIFAMLGYQKDFLPALNRILGGLKKALRLIFGRIRGNLVVLWGLQIAGAGETSVGIESPVLCF